MRFSFLFIFLLSSLSIQAQEPLKTIKLTDRVSIKLPEGFSPMTEEEISQRILVAKRPIAIYTDRSRSIDFSLSMSPTAWDERDLGMMKDFYKSTFYSVYDEVEMLQDELIKINDRDFIVFKLRSVVKGENLRKPVSKFHYLTYTIIKGNLYLFNFTCDIQEQRMWESSAELIMQSIKIK